MEFIDHMLTWYMKYQTITQDKMLENIKQALLKKFKKPKFESWCIIELKETRQLLDESFQNIY